MKSKALMIGSAIIVILIALIIYSSFSAQSIVDIKTTENVGKTVTAKGEVKNVIKIGQLSGYTLEDDSGTIAVSSEELPAEGQTVRVKGTLIKDTIFGYYIKVN